VNRKLAARCAATAGAAGLLLAAGCSSAPTAPQQPTARMEQVGHAAVPSVVLTPLGAARIGVLVRPAKTRGAEIAIPYSALLYESDGSTAVYVNTGRLTYTRYLVTVDNIIGNLAFIKPGQLPADATVVTQGAEELLGVQNGVGVET
jgi:hypothetical protein